MKKLYFLFPDVSTVRMAVDSLLLKRIDMRHMRVVAKEGMDIGDLPEATVFQKYDIRHSLIVGVPIGALLGIGTGIALHSALNMEMGGLMIVTTLIGAFLGGWFASMVGLITPNTDLKPFFKALNQGKVLLIVNSPYEMVEEVENTVHKIVPSVVYKRHG